MNDTAAQLSPFSILLHWAIGLAIIGMLALGLYMEEAEAFDLYPLHKSIGVTILMVALIRVVWRFINRWPTALSQDGAFTRFIARLVHWILLLGAMLMPITGAVMSGVGGHGIAFFGLELVATNPDPLSPLEVLPHNEALAGFAHSAHGFIAYVIIATLLLHIAGALKHHMLNKDGTLRRMLGKRVERDF